MNRFLLLSATFALLWLGCDDPAPPEPTPIERRVVLEDLLQTAKKGPDVPAKIRKLGRWRSYHLLTEASLPERSVLFLDGRISRSDFDDETPIGPSTFRVVVDGEEVFSRTLNSDERHGRFETSVPLNDWGGETKNVEVFIDNPQEDKTNAYWMAARIEEIHPTPRRPRTEGPNLLFVMVDTLRADHCSLYGYERKTTPFLEELAQESLVFDRALAPASWTLPAVASILTGLTPPRHGAIDKGPLAYEHETLAETLQEVGFTTFAASANPIISPQDGFTQGFEEFQHLPWRSGEKIRGAFQQWAADKKDLQWFAYLHFIDPHDPYNAPEPAAGTWADPDYDGPFREKKALNQLYFTQNFGLEPAFEYGREDLDFLIDSYDEEILFWDEQIRMLMDWLRAEGLDRRTIVVIVGDHGEEFGDHDKLKHGHHLYDETVRVPLMLRGPKIEPGRRTEAVDTRLLHRAVRQLLAVDAPAPEPGDLLAPAADVPVFLHTRYPIVPDEPLNRHGMAAVEHQGWKLIRGLDDERLELYRMSEDGDERLNLAVGEAERASEYEGLLRAWIEVESQASTQETSTEIDPATLEKLQELGYIQ